MARPLFCRSKIVIIKKEKLWYVNMFVSGTASIRGGKVLHIGNASKQTEITLLNIRYLVSRTNLIREANLGHPDFKNRMKEEFKAGSIKDIELNSNLKKEVVIIGVGDRIELWNEDVWNKYIAAAEKESGDLAEGLSEFGI